MESKSYYYRETVFRRRKTKKFMKLSISADLNTQLICASVLRKGRAHDTKDFIMLLRQTSSLPTLYVSADKGYDSRKLRRYVFLFRINRVSTKPDLSADSNINICKHK